MANACSNTRRIVLAPSYTCSGEGPGDGLELCSKLCSQPCSRKVTVRMQTSVSEVLASRPASCPAGSAACVYRPRSKLRGQLRSQQRKIPVRCTRKHIFSNRRLNQPDHYPALNFRRPPECFLSQVSSRLIRAVQLQAAPPVLKPALQRKKTRAPAKHLRGVRRTLSNRNGPGSPL